MNTFRNKQFKNELDPKYAFYDCLRTCELKSKLLTVTDLYQNCLKSAELHIFLTFFFTLVNKNVTFVNN